MSFSPHMHLLCPPLPLPHLLLLAGVGRAHGLGAPLHPSHHRLYSPPVDRVVGRFFDDAPTALLLGTPVGSPEWASLAEEVEERQSREQGGEV